MTCQLYDNLVPFVNSDDYECTFQLYDVNLYYEADSDDQLILLKGEILKRTLEKSQSKGDQLIVTFALEQQQLIVTKIFAQLKVKVKSCQ